MRLIFKNVSMGLMRGTQRKQLSDGEFLADKLMDLANLAVVVMVFGQFVAEQKHWDVLFFGAVLYLVAIVAARRLRR